MDLQQIIQKPTFRWGVAILWTVFFTVQLLEPEQQALATSLIQPAPASLQRELFFTSLHLITFGFTAWLWCFAGQITVSDRLRWGLLSLILIVYGASAEMLQMTIPGRNAQWWDMLANVIGIMLGILIWFSVHEIQLWLQHQGIRRYF